MLHLNKLEYTPNFQALSLFRICFASFLLVQWVLVLPFYREFYGADGVLPLAALALDPGLATAALLPLLKAMEALGFAQIALVLYPASLVALALGYRTRWAGGLALLCQAYLFWRNPYVDSGAEVLTRLLLLWGLFLPLNRYWSIDAALDPEAWRRAWPALPFFALRLQLSSLYFFSGLFKIEGAPWREGVALNWILQDTLFGAAPAGLFFAAHFAGLLAAVSYAVIAFQLSFPYLIYSPWCNELTRAIALAGSAAMHLSFIVFLYIGGFPYLCLIMLILLVPDRWIEWVLRGRRAGLAGMVLYYEPDCAFCQKLCLLFREFLLAPTVDVLPASADETAHRLLVENNSWVVKAPNGATYLKWRGVAYVLRQNVLTAPLGAFSDWRLLRDVTARLYDTIGRHRRAFGTLTRRLLPFRSDGAPGGFVLALNGLLMVLALASNLLSLSRPFADQAPEEIYAPTTAGWAKALDEIFSLAQVRQAWALFAPGPTHWNWEFRFVAIHADGSTTDETDALPFVGSASAGRAYFAHPYWQKYFSRYELLSDADLAALGFYLCQVESATVAALDVALIRSPVPMAPGARSGPRPGIALFAVVRNAAPDCRRRLPPLMLRRLPPREDIRGARAASSSMSCHGISRRDRSC